MARWSCLLALASGVLFLYIRNLPPIDDVEASATNVAVSPEVAGKEADVLSDEGGWVVKHRVDPMTDAGILSASRAYQGQAARIRVAVRCSNHKNLYYLFTTVDGENGTPVSMSTVPNPAVAATAFKLSGGLMLVQSVINYAVRIDGQPSQNGNAINPSRDNQLLLSGTSKPLSSTELAKGTVLHVRLPVEGGSEVVEIDQSAKGIAEVIQDCAGRGAAPDAGEASTDDAPIPQALRDMGYTEDGTIKPGNVVLDQFEFETVGSSAQSEWIGKVLSRSTGGISIGLLLYQPQISNYAVLRHTCKSPADYHWEKFWVASPDSATGTLSANEAAAQRAKEEQLDELANDIFRQFCSRASATFRSSAEQPT
jgi:hypothetical protein